MEIPERISHCMCVFTEEEWASFIFKFVKIVIHFCYTTIHWRVKIGATSSLAVFDYATFWFGMNRTRWVELTSNLCHFKMSLCWFDSRLIAERENQNARHVSIAHNHIDNTIDTWRKIFFHIQWRIFYKAVHFVICFVKNSQTIASTEHIECTIVWIV